MYTVLLCAAIFSDKRSSGARIKKLTEKDIMTLADIKSSQNILAINTDAVTRRVV